MPAVRAALTRAFAADGGLLRRDQRDGTGQVIDLSIYEPLFWILGPGASVYQQLGYVQNRTGNRAPFTAPRNAYLSKDGVWLVSSASRSIAERVMTLVGHPEFVQEPWFANHTAGSSTRNGLLHQPIAAWIADRDADEVVDAFEEIHAANIRADPVDRPDRQGPAVHRARDAHRGSARQAADAERHPASGRDARHDPVARCRFTTWRYEPAIARSIFAEPIAKGVVADWRPTTCR